MKKKYKTKFTDAELSKALHKNDDKVGEIIENKEKWEDFKFKLNSLLEKVRKAPVIGSVVDDLLCMIEMVDLYIKDEYKDIPKGTIVSIVLALIYVFSPLDLIPDVIPVIGYVDDVAVVMFVLKKGVDKDLDKFREWKLENYKKEIRNFAIYVSYCIIKHINDNYLASIILCKGNYFKLLYSDTKKQDKPIECKVVIMTIPNEGMKYFDNEYKEVVELLEQELAKKTEFWMDNAKKNVYLESDFDEFWDDYIIEEV